MKKLFLVSILFLAFYNCEIMAQDTLDIKIPGYGDSLTLEGKFVKHQFHNKAGRAIEGAYDLFFEISKGQSLFVKRMKCNFPEGELKDNFNKTFIIKASKNFGLWDADDNTVQSRVGDYIEVYEIKNKK